MSIDALVVGLGNPGKEYAKSRHNVGHECVEVLAARGKVVLTAGRDKALVAERTIGERRVLLAFPTTYMNDSGMAVAKLMRRHGFDSVADIVVVHDELDLPPSVVRIKVGGGLAGHNGLRSLVQHLHSPDFVRVRIGVGKPPSKEEGANHVLSRMHHAERKLLDVAVEEAADAVEIVLADGTDAAMRRFNVR